MTTHHSWRPSTPRIAPVKNPTDEVREAYLGGLAGPDGEPLNIFSTLAHNPKLLKRFTRYAGWFLNKGLLPPREREIVILRVGWNCRSEYEFGQHTVIGLREGLTPVEIAALTRDAGGHPWTGRDATLIAMCDDLCTDDCVSDGVWTALAADWNEAELVELVMLAGTYRLVSGFLNTMGVQRDAGVPGFPNYGS
ncbi:MAG: carboxymuconolactone decarboxylase family protein [Acidimicrobiales bacterium]